ncbi:MAG TPA: right-handed parallel beta-helix repeat-containing protein [Terriglobales bacterium]|nr:right-handed parallel beta-helix repeat-containing protein [Terriglobales bacterium]
MSPRTLLLLAVALFVVSPLNAATYYVGTCHSPSFATISDAVGAPTVAPGSTIKICGGSYFEQVIISKPLTLIGIVGTEGNADVLIAGSSGSMLSAVGAVFNNLFTPLVWVKAGPVTIQDITVDDDFLSCANTVYVGFYLASGVSGTLNRVASQGQCVGASVYAENATSPVTSVTIENSFLNNGIDAVGAVVPAGDSPLLDVKITGNQVTPNVPAPPGSGGNGYGNGIYLYEVSGTVATNSIFGPKQVGPTAYNGIGIWDESAGVTVSSNTIMFNGFDDPLYKAEGIAILEDQTTVKSNKISGVQYGIDMGCHPSTVTSNTINLTASGLLSVPRAFTGINSVYNSFVATPASDCP